MTVERPFDPPKRNIAAEFDQLTTALEDARDEATAAVLERDAIAAQLMALRRTLAQNDAAGERQAQQILRLESERDRLRDQLLRKAEDASQTTEELRVALEEARVLSEELAEKNQALLDSKEQLEERVAARTRELQLANEVLAAERERLSLAQRYAAAGTWDWDMVRNKVSWSDEYCDLFGMNPDGTPSYEAWLESVFPDDREAATRELAACLRKRHSEFQLEYRIIHPRKGVRWLAGRGRFLFDDGREPVRMVGLTIDVTDRKLAEMTAAAARAEAEEANHAKSRFLAAASHDLRQPVMAASLFLGLLEGKVRDPELQNLVQMVGLSLDGLKGMLNGLLEVARLEAGAVSPQFQSFALDDLLQRLSHEFEAPAYQAKLWLQVPPTGAVIRSDKLLLELILRNLLSNAIKHTRAGGVTIDVSHEGDQVRIDVTDTGPGIPADQQERIFEEFVQLNSDSPRGRGFGIGLATVRRAAALLHHRLGLKSAPRRGSTFSIWVPDGSQVSEAAPAENVTERDLRPCSVLVVEDDPSIADGLALTLRGWGAAVTAVNSLRAAAAVSGEFDLLVTDNRLPDGTGLELIEQIRRRHRAPAILLTGDTHAETLRKAQDIGITLLHKPVELPALKRSILAALHNDSDIADLARANAKQR